MWTDPIVEETRRLRDQYAAEHHYDVAAIARDLRDWERSGFPMPKLSDPGWKPTTAQTAAPSATDRCAQNPADPAVGAHIQHAEQF